MQVDKISADGHSVFVEALVVLVDSYVAVELKEAMS